MIYCKKKAPATSRFLVVEVGTILPEEIEELHAYGITRLYHPDDGRKMGLQGMINDLVEKSDFLVGDTLPGSLDELVGANNPTIARWISAAENCGEQHGQGNSINYRQSSSHYKRLFLELLERAGQERVPWSMSWFVALPWISMISVSQWYQ